MPVPASRSPHQPAGTQQVAPSSSSTAGPLMLAAATRGNVIRGPGRTSALEGLVEAIVARIQQKFDKLEAGFDNVEGVHGAGFRYRAARRRT